MLVSLISKFQFVIGTLNVDIFSSLLAALTGKILFVFEYGEMVATGGGFPSP
jgi:hypothetical protein